MLVSGRVLLVRIVGRQNLLAMSFVAQKQLHVYNGRIFRFERSNHATTSVSTLNHLTFEWMTSYCNSGPWSVLCAIGLLLIFVYRYMCTFHLKLIMIMHAYYWQHIQRIDIKPIHCPHLFSPAIIFISGCNLHQESLDRAWHLDSQHLAKRIYGVQQVQHHSEKHVRAVFELNSQKESGHRSVPMKPVLSINTWSNKNWNCQTPSSCKVCCMSAWEVIKQQNPPTFHSVSINLPAGAFADWNLFPL